MVDSNRVIARQAIINAYAKQGYDVGRSEFLKEITDGLHDDIFTIKAIEEALELVKGG